MSFDIAKVRVRIIQTHLFKTTAKGLWYFSEAASLRDLAHLCRRLWQAAMAVCAQGVSNALIIDNILAISFARDALQFCTEFAMVASGTGFPEFVFRHALK